MLMHPNLILIEIVYIKQLTVQQEISSNLFNERNNIYQTVNDISV